MATRSMSPQQIERVLPRARLIVAAAEREQHRQLTAQQRRNLLKDHTRWPSQSIPDIVQQLERTQ